MILPFRNTMRSRYRPISSINAMSIRLCSMLMLKHMIQITRILVKRDSYGWRSVERLERLKDWTIEDVRDFIEDARADKIKEIDECIDRLILEKEKFLPNIN